ncbi:TlpA family protein disulfide reductase [Mucilaginibacter paludis]|uniref:Redoxin domain protein n=1 Tax=Mucilaginibacter paludis DSM 18603 TaxID=714943 RepID=H1YA41_9SPHI|nr:TlpA disulfide reductase family protein [Mucilaginibacter paludis]EHQ25025.1 Redoxin domain protein [Mucilaginibacter paludis DSM 18603]
MKLLLLIDLLDIKFQASRKITLFLCIMLSALLAIAQTPKTTYSGKITGYSGNMGFTTGKLIRNNVITGVNEMYVINIQPDGNFSLTFPLVRNEECWISFPFFNSWVYFEAGKNIVQDFNIADIPKVVSAFKGDAERVNNDMNKVRPVLMDYNWDKIYADIYQLTPEQYKSYFLKIQSSKLALIDSIAKQPGFDKIAWNLAVRNVKYGTASDLIHYNYTREAAYRMQNKLSFNNREPVLRPVTLKADYYDFLKTLKYNDPCAMVCYCYFEFMNRLMFMDLIYDSAGLLDYTKEIESLKSKDTSDANIKATIKIYQDMMSHKATKPGALEKARTGVLKGLIHADISLELDLMYLQPLANELNYKTDTLKDDSLAKIKSVLKHKFLMGDVVALNDKIKQNISNVKKQTSYADSQIPVNTTADSILSAILDRYKGKVVFIDFWATWCAPCIQSIQEIAPLKEELAQDKDIVFLYITDTSSPEKTYQAMMPHIKGEHYRLSQDQHNFLTGRFQINGIPHYVIVNKQGRVVDPDFKWHSNAEIKLKLQDLEK